MRGVKRDEVGTLCTRGESEGSETAVKGNYFTVQYVTGKKKEKNIQMLHIHLHEEYIKSISNFQHIFIYIYTHTHIFGHSSNPQISLLFHRKQHYKHLEQNICAILCHKGVTDGAVTVSIIGFIYDVTVV